MNILREFSRQQIIKVLIFISLFLVAYAGVIGLYRIEATKGVADFVTSVSESDYIEVSVNVTNIDPVKGDIAARMQFVPHGKLALENGNKISQGVKLVTNTSTGKPERTFDEGKVMEPIDVVFPIFDGQVNDYPFDRHESLLEIEMANAADPTTSISTQVNFWANIPGFSTKATLNPESDSSYTAINIGVDRSITTIFFSLFIMVGMWIVGIIVLIQSQIVRSKGKMVEIGMFAYMATLIFALPAVRNIQPGIPPVGAFSDFLSFFWAEGLATVSFITIAYCWLTRYGK
jgi:hypothetical protein